MHHRRLKRFHNGNRTCLGTTIGNYLIVSHTTDGWGVYKQTTKRKGSGLAVNVYFSEKIDAVTFASFLGEKYESFLPIWEADLDLNPFALAKWTVPGGIKIWSLIEALEELDGITLVSLESLKKPEISSVANQRFVYWTRNQNWISDSKGKFGVI